MSMIKTLKTLLPHNKTIPGTKSQADIRNPLRKLSKTDK